MNIELSVLVVTFNNADSIERFHRELMASLAPALPAEVLYHDNSPDGSVAQALEALEVRPERITTDPENPGFAAGVNRLVKRARGRFIALVNPDVQGFSTGFWRRLLASAEPGQARFIRLLDGRGRMQDCVGQVPSLRRALLSGRTDWAAIHRPREIETGIMAFMLTDRQSLLRVGPLDEEYWMYAEDLDWCWRARRAGVQLLFDPRFELTHLGGQSAATIMDASQQQLAKYRAEARFIRKHYRRPYRWLMLLLNQLKLRRWQ